MLSSIGAVLLLSGCNNEPVPSKYTMSCTQLVDKERSLQEDLKDHVADSIVNVILSSATNDSIAAAEADNRITEESYKNELRDIHRVIYEKGC